MTTPAIAKPIAGTEADHRVTLAQIGMGNLMAVGAIGGPDRIAHLDRDGLLRLKLGKRAHWMDVVLTVADTYTVRVSRFPRGSIDAIEVSREEDVHADQLAATVRRLGDI